MITKKTFPWFIFVIIFCSTTEYSYTAADIAMQKAHIHLQETFELDKLSPWHNAGLNIGIMTAVVGLIVGIQYVKTNYLIQKKHLVTTDYPYAQAWYDAMAIKYPKAHLDQKLFLQTFRHVHKNQITWCSIFNDIYFPQKSLQDINRLYKNVIDGIELSREDQLLLGKEEFILLHEAGHIEHGDIFSRLVSIIGIFATLELLRAYYMSANLNWNTLESYNRQNTANNLYIIELLLFFPMIFNMLSRSHEKNADKFSYSQIDENALHGGISFFENEDIDPLFDIENKTVSPFIPVDSSFGKLMQVWANHEDQNQLTQLKAIKAIPIWHSFYKWMNASSHPYPSDRAQAIKDELAKR